MRFLTLTLYAGIDLHLTGKAARSGWIQGHRNGIVQTNTRWEEVSPSGKHEGNSDEDISLTAVAMRTTLCSPDPLTRPNEWLSQVSWSTRTDPSP